jgi:hypothetical protein
VAVVASDIPTLVALNLIDPRLPIAQWEAFVSVAGDLTGGTVQLTVNIRSSTFQPPGAFWNIEVFQPRALGNLVPAPQLLHLFISSFRKLLGGSSPVFSTILTLLADANINRTTIGSDFQVFFHYLREVIFGVRNIEDNSGTTTSLTAEFNTNSNTTSYEFYARGYFWRRDVFAFGYPLRPQQILLPVPPLK